MENYYVVFNLNPEMSSEEILAKLKEEKKTWTIRSNAPNLTKRQEAEQKLQLIQEAQKIFSDNLKRKEYDVKLRREGGSQQQQQPQPQQRQQYTQPQPRGFTPEQVITEVRNLYDSGNSEATVNACNAYINAGFHMPSLYYYLGHAYWETGQTNLAIAAFKNGINASDHDNDAPFYGDLANLYMMTLHDTATGGQYIDKAIEADPQNNYYQSLYVLRMLMDGQTNEAETYVSERVNANPNDLDYRTRVSETYLTFSDMYFSQANNGNSYIDSQDAYNSVLYWRTKANELVQSERTTTLLNNWKNYGAKKFNKDNIGGLAFVIIVSILFSEILVPGLAIAAVLIYFSFKPMWTVDKMAVTGQRDVANMVCHVFSGIAKFILMMIYGILEACTAF